MQALTLLPRLPDHHDYAALHETCLDAEVADPDAQELWAAAEVHLGDTLSGRRAMASFDCATLPFDGDLSAVSIALGELDPAVAILEGDRWNDTVEHPRGAK